MARWAPTAVTVSPSPWGRARAPRGLDKHLDGYCLQRIGLVLVYRVGWSCDGGSGVGRRRTQHTGGRSFFYFRFLSLRKTDVEAAGATRTAGDKGATGQRGKPVLLEWSASLSFFLALTFVPATAPCAVMLPTGEQLSTRSTLKSLSNSDDGMRELLLWVGFASLLLCQAEADNGEEYRDHHGLFVTGPIAQLAHTRGSASTTIK